MHDNSMILSFYVINNYICTENLPLCSKKVGKLGGGGMFPQENYILGSIINTDAM